MAVPHDVEIKLLIRGTEIVGVEATGSDTECTPCTLEERKLYESSPYGLRTVDTLYETQITQSPTQCFMVIGGFKIRVRCP